MRQILIDNGSIQVVTLQFAEKLQQIYHSWIADFEMSTGIISRAFGVTVSDIIKLRARSRDGSVAAKTFQIQLPIKIIIPMVSFLFPRIF